MRIRILGHDIERYIKMPTEQAKSMGKRRLLGFLLEKQAVNLPDHDGPEGPSQGGVQAGVERAGVDNPPAHGSPVAANGRQKQGQGQDHHRQE